MIRFTAGVQAPYFNPRLAIVLEYASVWAITATIPVDVNALGDKQHMPNSLHPWGLAVDLDTDGDRPADLVKLHGFLARYLPLEYDVVLEKDHVHVEFDPKRHPSPTPPPWTPPATTPA